MTARIDANKARRRHGHMAAAAAGFPAFRSPINSSLVEPGISPPPGPRRPCARPLPPI